MDKFTEEQFIDLFSFRTRHLHEFNLCYEKCINCFESLVIRKELGSLDKPTLKEYAILRDIASLAPYLKHFDEEMLNELPSGKILKCVEIVDYFEKKSSSSYQASLFTKPSELTSLSAEKIFTRLNDFVLIDKPLDQQVKPQKGI